MRKEIPLKCLSGHTDADRVAAGTVVKIKDLFLVSDGFGWVCIKSSSLTKEKPKMFTIMTNLTVDFCEADEYESGELIECPSFSGWVLVVEDRAPVEIIIKGSPNPFKLKVKVDIEEYKKLESFGTF